MGYTVYEDHFLLMTRVLTGISGAACLLVVVSFASFPQLRWASGHYSLWVALANLINAACTFADGRRGSVQCEVTAWGRTFGGLAQVAVSVVIANRLLVLFASHAEGQDGGAGPGADGALERGGESLGMRARRLLSQTRSLSLVRGVGGRGRAARGRGRGQLNIGWRQFVAVWVLPLLLSLVPFVLNSYGKPEGGQWCWLNDSGWHRWHYLFLLYYAPLWAAIIYTCTVYAHVYAAGRAQVREAEAAEARLKLGDGDGGGDSSSVPSRPRTASAVQSSRTVRLRLQVLVAKVAWYPFNLVFCNVFATAVKIAALGFNSNPPGLEALGWATFGLLGLLDSAAYFLTPSVQAAWGSWYRLSFRRRSGVRCVASLLQVLCCCCRCCDDGGGGGSRTDSTSSGSGNGNGHGNHTGGFSGGSGGARELTATSRSGGGEEGGSMASGGSGRGSSGVGRATAGSRPKDPAHPPLFKSLRERMRAGAGERAGAGLAGVSSWSEPGQEPASSSSSLPGRCGDGSSSLMSSSSSGSELFSEMGSGSSRATDASGASRASRAAGVAGTSAHSTAAASASGSGGGVLGMLRRAFGGGQADTLPSHRSHGHQQHPHPPRHTHGSESGVRPSGLHPTRVSASRPSAHAWAVLLLQDLVEGGDDGDGWGGTGGLFGVPESDVIEPQSEAEMEGACESQSQGGSEGGGSFEQDQDQDRRHRYYGDGSDVNGGSFAEGDADDAEGAGPGVSGVATSNPMLVQGGVG